MDSKDLNEIYDYENFLKKYQWVLNWIKVWIWLNVFPEEGFSDILAWFSYIYSYFIYLSIKNSKFQKEDFYKYD